MESNVANRCLRHNNPQSWRETWCAECAHEFMELHYKDADSLVMDVETGRPQSASYNNGELFEFNGIHTP